ncbi:AbrB/MazE/SpoVT family DNA-binding domain-containing protein [Haloferax sp. S2CR25-2]|nr:AbrB/MazE/SpoVT family DNA-binding domain-containing protein [Haloferax sp. S2CR25]MDS0446772.1 AbrB/MazE/SpoVT family DNA-binding domain-containing protein [Haloferax sp. S2CR25-2]
MGDSTKSLLNQLPDDLLGRLAKRAVATSMTDVQDELRDLGKNFLQRNALFTAKVQTKRRVTIPKAEIEKLGIEEGDLIQVAVTPVDRAEDLDK